MEQRIINGLAHVPKKSGKLKLDYIDLDLVRGSSFPKVKPKHGLVYLTQLCLLRLLFLPFYRHWWIRQTSWGIFQILLVLYAFQIINTILYITRPAPAVGDLMPGIAANVSAESQEVMGHDISAEEVLVPGFMMCLLSLLLSQVCKI